MIWKRYQNELIVLLSLLVLFVAMGYKQTQVTARSEMSSNMKHSAAEFKELLLLKKRWVDKKTGKKIDKLQSLAEASKVKWKKSGKKLTVNYKGLTPKELNKVITTLLNLAVQIEHISIKNQNGNYNVELKCKW